ncbi:MAG: Fic family protein [Nanoarchaeota archaeon]|nr:Fic family protein [Nanoarchaeota archaeon]MBU1321520.1 Fic family protein [Nanoarchaeota archaeon]MBU1597137.1 Fic family protein [Nanoarchaeota archaeon]MBU2441066.1 Fic family protein [Nanoarchaeota archaeon]
MLINKKDLIRINQEIGEKGAFSNESTLDFALDIMKQKKSWLYELSYLVRSILVDHVFADGNKRTAFVLITIYLDEKNLDYDDQKLVKVVLEIAKNNIKNPKKITGLIKNAIE